MIQLSVVTAIRSGLLGLGLSAQKTWRKKRKALIVGFWDIGQGIAIEYSRIIGVSFMSLY
jgi:hypothetical protein